MNKTTTVMAIIAIVTALGLVGLVAITVVPIQQAEAIGCLNDQALEASDGACFGIPNSPHPPSPLS